MPYELNEADSTLQLSGELDLNDVPELRAAVEQFAGDSLTVLASDVAYMDSSVLSTLLLARKQCAGRGGKLVIKAPSDIVRSLLTSSQLDRVLTIED